MYKDKPWFTKGGQTSVNYKAKNIQTGVKNPTTAIWNAFLRFGKPELNTMKISGMSY